MIQDAISISSNISQTDILNKITNCILTWIFNSKFFHWQNLVYLSL